MAEIYENILKSCVHRRVTLDETLEPTAVTKMLKHQEYVIIRGVRVAADGDPRPAVKFFCVLAAPESRYTSRAADLYKLLKEIGLDHKNRDVPQSPPLEILMVTGETLNASTMKTIASFSGPTVYISVASYANFVTDITRSKMTPRHEIMSDAEIDEFCRENKKIRADFPKIENDDGMAIWLGLRPGMCVRVYRMSAPAGEMTAFRLCIRAKTHTSDADDGAAATPAEDAD